MTTELATKVLNTIFDNGRIIQTNDQEEFESSVRVEAEFEAQELGATSEEVDEIVEFCLAHSKN